MYYGPETILIVERNATRTDHWLILALNGPQIPMTSSAKGSNQSSGIRAEDGDDDEIGHDSGTATATAKPKLKRPSMYKVLVLNDDFTPMEFVVHVLEVFFAMDREKATQIMLTVHTQGAAVVGIFPRDIAETKSEQVNQYAQENQHPLVSTIEMTD